ncbi:hypothetical protein [Micromonospora zamorensis]|uniref:hypothetical protein n=1 Tax=Micromonospora zamorensis TaxID=709883 RepID=UPI00081FAC3A|nr:hypothetical protein [Micromonospora zamorensis]SCG60152.1 hypothetical protein GA0070619_4131 [Micromonospora zamorensis]
MILASSVIDIGATAASYSQVAGVLAGFAFSALLLYLNRTPGASEHVQSVNKRRPDEGSQVHQQVTVVLFNTLGSLIICAVSYGILASHPPDSEIAFSAIFLHGPAFCLAILGMFYATALAAAPFGHLLPMLASARILVGVIGPVVAMTLIAAAALDIDIRGCIGQAAVGQGVSDVCRVNKEVALTRPYGFGLLLSALTVLIGVLALVVFRKPRTPPPLWIPKVMARLIIGSAVTMIAGTVFVGTKPVTYLLPDPALFGVLALSFAILTSFAVLAARSCHYFPDVRSSGDYPGSGQVEGERDVVPSRVRSAVFRRGGRARRTTVPRMPSD